MRYKVKYGPEVINEFDDFKNAADWLLDAVDFRRGPSTMYLYDSQDHERHDYPELKEDADSAYPGWNDHLPDLSK